MNRRVFAFVALLAAAFTASAHTNVKSAEPADGAVLDTSPPAIRITFEHPVQMTSVTVVAENAAERKLAFAATEGGTVITVDNPQLVAGRNEIRWRALSKDGHVIKGKLTYTVKSATAGW